MKSVEKVKGFKNGVSAEITIIDKNGKSIKFVENITFDNFSIIESTLKNAIELMGETVLLGADKMAKSVQEKNLVWNEKGKDFSNTAKSLIEQMRIVRKGRELV